jgi:topoisomerase IV subunit A
MAVSTRWPTLLGKPCSTTRTATLRLAMRWYSWGKKICSSIPGKLGKHLTGDGAAAPRYIEARLSKFALDVVFNPKTTNWQLVVRWAQARTRNPSGENFLCCWRKALKGLPWAFGENYAPQLQRTDRCVDCIPAKREPFEIFPDFPTGGMIDVSNTTTGFAAVGARRAKIDKNRQQNTGQLPKFHLDETPRA